MHQREGAYRVRLLDNLAGADETGYAGLELLPDGTFVATTYCDLSANGTNDPDIVSVRFTMTELDALAGGPFCGMAGTVYLPSDLNHDCYVNLADFAIFCQEWLSCTDPLRTDLCR